MSKKELEEGILTLIDKININQYNFISKNIKLVILLVN